MENITTWLTANWEWIAIAMGILIQVLQLASKHWSEHQGFKKALTFLTEMLSIFTSIGAINGKAGKLKLPLQSVRPK